MANLVIFFVVLLIIFGRAIFSINHLYIGIEGDSSFYMWITKWFSQPFSHTDIFHATNVYFPMGLDLSGGWEGSILYYLGGILNSLFSVPAAYNLLIVIPFLLDWVAVYFVLYKFSRRLAISGLFSTLFCISSFFMARSLGHPSYLYFFHIPLLFYFLQAEQLEKLNIKRSALLVVIYTLISITSGYYLIFSFIITAVYLITFVIKKADFHLKTYKNIIFTYLGVLLAIVVFNFPIFKAFIFGSSYFYPYPFKMNNTELNWMCSMHAIDFFTPSTLNILYSSHPNLQIGNVERIIFPGISFYVLLGISAFFVLKRKELKKYVVFIAIGFFFFILALGYNSPLPLYRALTTLPFASSLHAPGRFAIVAIFTGWAFVAQASRLMKAKTATVLLSALILLQIFEVTRFSIPFENYDNLSILENLKTKSQSPVLELPMRSNDSSTLLIPAITDRNIFSGYPQHTTFSPQINYYTLNNVLDSLGTLEKSKPDILPELNPEESSAYLKWKFEVKDVALNKKFPLAPKAAEFLKYMDLSGENSSYAIYKLNNVSRFEKNDSVKVVTGKGIGQLINGNRTVAENAEFDILNFSSKPQKIRFGLEVAGIHPETKYFTGDQEIGSGIEIISQPGLGTLKIHADKKCTVSGADCITGIISKISLEKI